MQPSSTRLAAGLEWLDPVPEAWAGGRLTLRLRVANRSGEAWTARGRGSAQCVAAWQEAAGGDMAAAPPRRLLGDDLAPGAQRVEEVTIDVPGHAGALLFCLAVVPHGGAVDAGTFEDLPRWPLQVTDPAAICAARLEAECSARRVLPGAAVPLALCVHNDSEALWDSHVLGALCPRLDLQWQAASGDDALLRTLPPQPLPVAPGPGDQAWLLEEVPAPAEPGRWRLVAGLRVPGVYKGQHSPLTPVQAFEIEVASGADKAERRQLQAALAQAAEAALATVHRGRCAWEARLALPQHAARWLQDLQAPPIHVVAEADGAVDPRAVNVFLAPGCRLAALAPALLRAAFHAHPGIEAAYGDHDRLDVEGRRHGPVLARPPSLHESRERPAFGPLVAVRGRLARKLAKQAARRGPLALHELELRLLEHAGEAGVLHIPAFLSHRTAAAEEASPAARAAVVREHLRRSGCEAEVVARAGLASLHVRHALPRRRPRVALIIPSRDRRDLLQPCLDGLLARTAWDADALEVIVVDHKTTEPHARALLDAEAAAGRVRVLPYAGAFNWADMNNRAAAATDAEVLCLLNNDVEVMHEGWLAELVALVLQPGVGVAGATLWFGDGTLQHAGIRTDGRLSPLLLDKGGSREAWRQGWGDGVRRVSAVIGACLAVRREVYLAAGGMDAVHMPVAINDVDFCLRVRDALGLQVLLTPHAQLWHDESRSRGRAEAEDEVAGVERARRAFRGRWQAQATLDPALGPAFAPTNRLQPALLPRVTAGGWLRRAARAAAPRLAVGVAPGVDAGLLLQALGAPEPLRVRELGARTLLGCLEGDAARLAELQALAREADVLAGPLATGFGAAAGLNCWHGVLLQDPVERIRAHHRLLRAPGGPLAAAGLQDLPLAQLLARGIVRGNLASEMILGEPAEEATWAEIEAAGLAGAAHLAGSRLPRTLWSGLAGDATAAPAPRLQDVLQRLGTSHAFVARAHRLQEDMAALEEVLQAGIRCPGWQPRGTAAALPPLQEEDLGAIRTWAATDLALWEQVRDLAPQRLLHAGRLRETSLAG